MRHPVEVWVASENLAKGRVDKLFVGLRREPESAFETPSRPPYQLDHVGHGI